MLKDFIKNTNILNILLAYSGGIDSTFLLYQLLKLKKNNLNFTFRAIHINHQLHPDSEKWSDHCKKICINHNIPIIIKKITINSNKNRIEEIARKKRYQAIYKIIKPKEVLATGHNLNDQCETMLLALKRGSGITGLSSMSYKLNTIYKIKIVRPLLKISREDIKTWIYKHKIHWIEDTSNNDTKHDRNFLRLNIIPKLKNRWPYFEKNCSRSIEILNIEKKILKQEIKKKLNKYLVLNSILNISNFRYIDKNICSIILRHWIKINQNTMPTFKIVKEIYNKVIFSKIDSQPKIIIKNYQIRRYNNHLYWTKKIPRIENIILIWNNTQKKLTLPFQLGNIVQNDFGTTLPHPNNNETINIRFYTSHKVLITKNTKHKKLKTIFKEYKLPPWYRKKIPLIFYNNKFICALGLFVSNTHKKSNNEKNLKLSWISSIHNIIV
ncbi:putative cell cycle protein MesJ [Buchnera aphidicola str. Bp (Baizongia pistaciae)]|uniref:tRNA(Ile)-lysidine synthase n=1 Tax=Buchnera aphidicola subsp. Baizongia pistaciae (strain Bp) TaxID=224915 RepID=TILS_BUCBP|nr:tRNA lysidine(34) synthetase TilS [Buchnera aphidicola]Q89AX3.1 RecName: Full=tRNA(Ile)-lysidine synthase; AltName: Full=tRNA(Ile)-2-lysyl-cytidine synthase; AltName: Full=tRNA(Ile)-lysidine synthetase [Buchnera aphidicola str. Bp (Baizongia pistaciae)]AAO26839.1 putative cell cycle protein MesJ [Buchnera aphidicola str. Bp (Baizongia pistaciae)]